MSFNYLIPQPPDIPADGQPDYLNNFGLLNQFFNTDHVPFAGCIQNILNSNPCVISSANHTLSTGNTITLQGFNDNTDVGVVTGMGALNNTSPTITVIDENTFSLNGVDSTAYVPFEIGTFASYVSASLLYGFHNKISFNRPIGDPNLSSPQCSLYSKLPTSESMQSDLFYQNDKTTTAVEQLTGANFVTVNNGFGFRTSFGLIFNFGGNSIQMGKPNNFTFPIPYASSATVQCIIATGAFVFTTYVNNTTISAIPISATQFHIDAPFTLGAGSVKRFYYMAIGS